MCRPFEAFTNTRQEVAYFVQYDAHENTRRVDNILIIIYNY